MEEQITSLLMYTIPTLVTGVIAYLFFKSHIDNETNRRHFLSKKALEKEAFPLRLQAYERMALFLERIAPNKLLTRVQPISENNDEYEALLIANIEQEFEHNLSQQIYVSDQCWGFIKAAKNATIQLIRTVNTNEKTTNANTLREHVLKTLMKQAAPSDAALAFIKQEVSSIW